MSVKNFLKCFAWLGPIVPILPIVVVVGGLLLTVKCIDNRSNELFKNRIPTPPGFQRVEGNQLKKMEVEDREIVFTNDSSKVYVREFNWIVSGSEFDDYVWDRRKDFANRRIDWEHGKQSKGDTAIPYECYRIGTRFFQTELVNSVLIATCTMWDGNPNGEHGRDSGFVTEVSFIVPLQSPLEDSYNEAMRFLESYSKMVLGPMFQDSSSSKDDYSHEDTP